MLLIADNIRITNKIIEIAVNELNPAPIQAMKGNVKLPELMP